MEIRTRQFPIIFAVAGALFAGLFIAFYLLVLSSIQGIFTVQDRSTLEKLIADASVHHETVLRETKILHRSRGIQRHFASRTEEHPSQDVIRSLQRRLLDWHARSIDAPVYLRRRERAPFRPGCRARYLLTAARGGT